MKKKKKEKNYFTSRSRFTFSISPLYTVKVVGQRKFCRHRIRPFEYESENCQVRKIQKAEKLKEPVRYYQTGGFHGWTNAEKSAEVCFISKKIREQVVNPFQVITINNN